MKITAKSIPQKEAENDRTREETHVPSTANHREKAISIYNIETAAEKARARLREKERERALTSGGDRGRGTHPKRVRRRRGEGEPSEDEEADAAGKGGASDQLLQHPRHQSRVLLEQLSHDRHQYHLLLLRLCTPPAEIPNSSLLETDGERPWWIDGEDPHDFFGFGIRRMGREGNQKSDSFEEWASGRTEEGGFSSISILSAFEIGCRPPTPENGPRFR